MGDTTRKKNSKLGPLIIFDRKNPEVGVSDEVFEVPPSSPECQDARHHWKVTETIQ